MKRIKIASWNVAGGRPIKSLGRFDYNNEDLEYFTDYLKKISPDVVCLQETHTNSDRSLAGELGITLHLNNIINTPKNRSHIDENYMLGDAIISKYEFIIEKVYDLPNQWDEYYFSDGTKGVVHYKTLQEVKTKNFYIGNVQMLPISIFGHQYDKDDGLTLSKKIEDILMNLHRPLILCGDFNFSFPEKIYNNFLEKFQLKNALPDKGTRPTKTGEIKKSDYIFYSPEFKLINSQIIETQTDHFLCFAEFEYN